MKTNLCKSYVLIAYDLSGNRLRNKTIVANYKSESTSFTILHIKIKVLSIGKGSVVHEDVGLEWAGLRWAELN